MKLKFIILLFIILIVFSAVATANSISDLNIEIEYLNQRVLISGNIGESREVTLTVKTSAGNLYDIDQITSKQNGDFNFSIAMYNAEIGTYQFSVAGINITKIVGSFDYELDNFILLSVVVDGTNFDFDPVKTNYSLQIVDQSKTSISIELSNPSASLYINNKPVEIDDEGKGILFPIYLDPGLNHINIVASIGKIQKVYSLVLERIIAGFDLANFKKIYGNGNSSQLIALQNWRNTFLTTNDLFIGKSKAGLTSDLWFYYKDFIGNGDDQLKSGSDIAYAQLVLPIKEISILPENEGKLYCFEPYQIFDPDKENKSAKGKPYFNGNSGFRRGLNFNYRDTRPGKEILWSDGTDNILEMFAANQIKPVDKVNFIYAAMKEKTDIIKFDITETLQDWVDDQEYNQGLFLTISGNWEDGENIIFFNKESSSLKPYLQVTIADNRSVVRPKVIRGLTVDTSMENQISFKWTNPQNIAGVRIIKKEGITPFGPFDGRIVATTDFTTNQITDNGVVYGKPYYYNFYSFDANKNFSKKVSKLITAGSLTAPYNLRVNTNNDGQIHLFWNFMPDADAYQIIRKNNNNTVIFKNITDNKFVDQHVLTGQKYAYKVAAVNTAGIGEYVEIEALLPADRKAINVPGAINLQDFRLEALSGSQIKLSWNGYTADNHAGFIINRESNGVVEEIANLSFNEKEYIDKNLKPNRDYTYEILVYNSRGISNKTVASLKTLAKPVAVSELRWNILSASHLELSWIDNDPDNDSYLVEVYKQGGREELYSFSLGPEIESCYVYNLEPGIKYYFKVITIKDNQSIEVETETVFTISDPKGELL